MTPSQFETWLKIEVSQLDPLLFNKHSSSLVCVRTGSDIPSYANFTIIYTVSEVKQSETVSYWYTGDMFTTILGWFNKNFMNANS